MTDQAIINPLLTATIEWRDEALYLLDEPVCWLIRELNTLLVH